jgi:hypothetical protein
MTIMFLLWLRMDSLGEIKSCVSRYETVNFDKTRRRSAVGGLQNRVSKVLRTYRHVTAQENPRSLSIVAITRVTTSRACSGVSHSDAVTRSSFALHRGEI